MVAAFILVQFILIHSESGTLIFLETNSYEIINKWIGKNDLNVVKIKSEKQYALLLDILWKEIFYIFIEILLQVMSHWNFPDLLESLYSFEISQKLTTIKTGKKHVRKWVFLKIFAMKSVNFFQNEVGI